jgi:hypothetical protein
MLSGIKNLDYKNSENISIGRNKSLVLQIKIIQYESSSTTRKPRIGERCRRATISDWRRGIGAPWRDA